MLGGMIDEPRLPMIAGRPDGRRVLTTDARFGAVPLSLVERVSVE
jgi:hypothetical protein